MVTALDDAVGKIVTSLKKNKIYKNNFIMFTAGVSFSFLKVAYFQKVQCVFYISKSQKKIFQKNYPKLEI